MSDDFFSSEIPRGEFSSGFNKRRAIIVIAIFLALLAFVFLYPHLPEIGFFKSDVSRAIQYIQIMNGDLRVLEDKVTFLIKKIESDRTHVTERGAVKAAAYIYQHQIARRYKVILETAKQKGIDTSRLESVYNSLNRTFTTLSKTVELHDTNAVLKLLKQAKSQIPILIQELNKIYIKLSEM